MRENQEKKINYISKFLKKMILFIGIIVIFFGIVSCEEEKNKRVVGVTIIPQSTFVKKVCGNLVDVVTLVPTGSSPETFEPKPQDLIKLDDAILYFTIGVPTEKINVLDQLSSSTKVVHLEEACSKYGDIYFESGGRDPHIWLSPKRVITMIEVIRDEMIRVDSLHQDIYTENANNFIEELKNADTKIKEAIEKTKTKDFIAYHPAFGYFAADYNLNMYSLEQDGKEATGPHLIEMINFAKDNNIKVIFYQEEVDGSKAAAFANDIKGKAIKLEPLSADYINNLLNMAKVIAEVTYE